MKDFNLEMPDTLDISLKEYLETIYNKKVHNFYYKYKDRLDSNNPNLKLFFDEVYFIAIIFIKNYHHTPQEFKSFAKSIMQYKSNYTIYDQMFFLYTIQGLITVYEIHPTLVNKNGNIEKDFRSFESDEVFEAYHSIPELFIERFNDKVNEYYSTESILPEFENDMYGVMDIMVYDNYKNNINENEQVKDFINKLLYKAKPVCGVSKSLKWQGTTLELTELIKALINTNKLNPELTEKEIFNRFKEFLNVDDFDHTDKARDIRKRINEKTPFISKLETSLLNWIESKNK